MTFYGDIKDDNMMERQIETNLSQKQKKIHIETWGCQMNVADSEKILSLMKTESFELTHCPEEADLIVLNTCHIREKAKHKVLSRLGVLKELKEKNENLKIAVAGCVAQAEGKKLLQQAPIIDILVGPGKIQDLPELLHQEASGKAAISIGFSKNNDIEKNEDTCPTSPEATQSLTGKNEVSRFVNIQQGCNNFCTFCVVPFTRGRELSERPEIVYAKAKALVLHGAKEITLLGQNVNSYGHDLVADKNLVASERGPFVDLLARVAGLPDLQRLRFTTSNPHDLTKELADLFAKEPKLGKYFHLPVQSGSDRILKAMKRKVTVEEYIQRIEWLRSAVPDISISTDLIVGFPEESDEDFEQTLDLIKKVEFSFIYAFKYSPRKGTAAIRFRHQVPEEVKTKRLAQLNEIQDKITIKLNQSEMGKSREVLFLYQSQKEENVYYGRTEHFKLVKVPATRNLIGQLAPVEIIDANKTALLGRLV